MKQKQNYIFLNNASFPMFDFFYSSFKWVALFYCFLKSSYIIAKLLVSDFNRFFIVHLLTVLKSLYTWQLQPSFNIYRYKILFKSKIFKKCIIIFENGGKCQPSSKIGSFNLIWSKGLFFIISYVFSSVNIW